MKLFKLSLRALRLCVKQFSRKDAEHAEIKELFSFNFYESTFADLKQNFIFQLDFRACI